MLQQGHLSGLRPLKREREPDPPPPSSTDFPAVEIHLDTSGSMPDPQNALNCMTLAAQILAASALRRNGIVRGVVYSSGKPLLSEWLYDEEKARLFLLHYAGGGTDYPFALLRKLAKERGEVLRVIVSDSDFLWNVRQDGAMDALLYGCERSRLLVAFLACDEKKARQELAPALLHAARQPINSLWQDLLWRSTEIGAGVKDDIRRSSQVAVMSGVHQSLARLRPLFVFSIKVDEIWRVYAELNILPFAISPDIQAGLLADGH